jgi:riboflavin kinase/FMN adenylyltransferase
MEKLLPPMGGYASRVLIDGTVYYGITNIGTNPTISEGNPTTVETHVFDFSEQIYGKTINVQFLEFIRGEEKFDTIAALKSQIDADIAWVRNKFL